MLIKYEVAFSHLIPPVQNIAIFLYFFSLFIVFAILSNFNGNSLKELILGFIDPEKVPIDKIEIDILNDPKNLITDKPKKSFKYIIFISDFYYKDSAIRLKENLYNQTGINNILVREINKNKYRLLVGPFKSFDALKSSYISLNNLGFEGLNIFRE